MGTVENKKLFIVRIFKKTYTMSVTPFSKRISMLAMLLRVAGDIVGTRFAEAVDKSRIISFVESSPFADGLFR